MTYTIKKLKLCKLRKPLRKPTRNRLGFITTTTDHLIPFISEQQIQDINNGQLHLFDPLVNARLNRLFAISPIWNKIFR